MKEKINEFGDDYFYTLGLNLKFCSGIEKFLNDQDGNYSAGKYSDYVIDLISDWKADKRSQVRDKGGEMLHGK